MPVYSQWEIADALVYGPQGCPKEQAESFANWDFVDDLPDGSRPGEVENPYPRIDDYPVLGEKVKIYKALPLWPKAVEEGLCEFDDLADGAVVRKFYLSTSGVLEQSRNIWDEKIDKKPKSAIIVGHPDHRLRCQCTVDKLKIMCPDGVKRTVALEKTVLPSNDFYGDWSKFNCDPCGYDPTSTQAWTTCRPFYVATEASIRSMLYLKGDYGSLPYQEKEEQGEVLDKKTLEVLGKSCMLSLLAPRDEVQDIFGDGGAGASSSKEWPG